MKPERVFPSFCIIVFALMVTAFSSVFGGIGTWRSYTAKINVRALAVDRNGVLWAATGGGMYSYNPANGSYELFTASEGLRVNDLTALTIDTSGFIWSGASNGFIHSYNPRSGAWNYLADISLLTRPNKQINALKVTGDTLFILSEIGLSIYSISRGQFGDTYERFGSGGEQIAGGALSVALYNDSIWVGTRNGLAATGIANTNLSAPESWRVFTAADGLPSTLISGIESVNGKLYVATTAGVVERSNAGWSVVAGTAGLQVLSLSKQIICLSNGGGCTGTLPIFVTPSQLWSIDFSLNGIDHAELISSNAGSSLTVVTGSETPFTVYVGTQTQSALSNINGVWKSINPPGPSSNSFVGVAVDAHGTVWAGTGKDFGQGFQRFDGKTWRSYTAEGDPRLRSDNYYKVTIGTGDVKLVSNWGSGMALLDDAGNFKNSFFVHNGLLTSYDTAYVVVGGVATDRSGNLWITNRTPPGDTDLVVLHPDSSFSYVTGLTTNSPLTIFSDVTIDQYDTKWLSNYSRFESLAPSAVYYYNASNSVAGTINGWGRLTTDDGLTSNIAYCITLGHDGDVWIGSDQGITIIFDPSNPTAQMALYHPLNDQVVQAIYTDPLNNKWVATRQGVFELSSDGTVILQNYTVENTNGKLIGNDITSIGMDTKNGIMYFGTPVGLSAFTTDAATPVDAFGAINVYPNPYFLPSSTTLTISGLVANSSLKILSASGTLVKDVKTSGGKTGFWDGTDNKGNIVASGIYFIAAYNSDGSAVGTAKVAVLRK